ncbi:MFS transporter [Burkholderia multivorans]|uniref:MFS transporter n=1 Tax=Burkholderia multivorans TaxID=87883 RepID=UPI000D3BDA35|nr:MFS transporter [Burkholderia multivorans]MBR8017367.1 MFS transporter [Burkholderia multivorans]PTO49475.1 MFS transporter [Burkholderia multivorans]HEF4729112.1 MFS transporter [Burkholderia multivorans]
MNAPQRESGTAIAELPERWLSAFIATAAGVAIANNYTLQPTLPEIAKEFHSPLATMGLVAGSMQLGYMLGILLLVPVGDKISPSRLVFQQFVMLAVALGMAALAPSLYVLALAGCVIGAMATNAVHLATVAFRAAAPDERGKAVGTVGTGISAGILLSRFVGGALSEGAGWRVMLAICAAIAIFLAVLSYRLLPADQTRSNERYIALLGSLPTLVKRYPLLREGMFVGACWFFVFSMLWVTLVVSVAGPPLNLNAAQAGMFGFAGVLGLFATRAAGRAADRWGARRVIGGGFLLIIAGVLIMLLASSSIAGIALGVVLFDVGCFSAQVANQTRLLAIDVASRSRIYSIYMFAYYAAGAIGSIIGPVLLERYSWHFVCELAIVIAAVGFGVTIAANLANRKKPSENRLIGPSRPVASDSKNADSSA